MKHDVSPKVIKTDTQQRLTGLFSNEPSTNETITEATEVSQEAHSTTAAESVGTSSLDPYQQQSFQEETACEVICGAPTTLAVEG